MSVKIMDKVWDSQIVSIEHKTSPVTKLILLAIADNSNDLGECFPSITTIAKKCELADRTVQREIKKLEDWGIVCVDRSGERTKKYRNSNLYTIRLTGDSPVTPCHPMGDSHVTGDTHVTGDSHVTVPVTPCHPRGDTHVTLGVTDMSPKPSMNHHIKKDAASSDFALETEKEKKDPSTHKEFISKWCAKYESKFGHKYIFKSGQDGKAVKSLIETSGDTVDNLLALADRAWNQTDGKNFWWCVNQSATISGFSAALNNITKELYHARNGHKTSIGNRGGASQPFKREVGVCEGVTDYAELGRRKRAEAEARMAEAMASDGPNPPASGSGG